MKLQIDNLDGVGLRDYTSALDGSEAPRIIRKQNQLSELRFVLLADTSDFVVPRAGARVTLGKTNGEDVFSGYLTTDPGYEHLGWGERGPIYRYLLVAISDEWLLDQKRLPDRCPFVERSAGNALRQLTQDLLPGVFDTSATQDLDVLPDYTPDPQKTWSQQAAEIALQARASYQMLGGRLIFAPAGTNVYELNESDAGFCPQGLTITPVRALINDVTVVGEIEPQDYVRDYFVGDGLTRRFYLSQTPFTKTSKTLFDEEYTSSPLEPTLWKVTDPSGAVSAGGGSLRLAGGTGVDGTTTVSFVEQIELGGALVMQHGDVTFTTACSGVLGGLYAGAVAEAGCLAGFCVRPNGTQCNLQALIKGAVTGPLITTTPGHHYILITRFYSQEIYRKQQIFHSSLHPAGNGLGGAEITADVQIVLQLQDIDPANPASLAAPATVLYDGLIANAPGFCTYALANSGNLQCSIAFTRVIDAVDAEVRTALPGQGYTTQLVGPLSEGTTCNVTSSAVLEFYSANVPAANEQIEVHYRGQGRALARVTDPASVAAEQCGIDDGVHGTVRKLMLPQARTSADCENAALALFDDTTGAAWAGCYEVWSDFLPGMVADIFPGDVLSVNVPSRNAGFRATVREVEISAVNLANDRSVYKIGFANDAARPIAFEFSSSPMGSSLAVPEQTTAQVGANYVGDLTAAAITAMSSTTVSVDAGVAPPMEGGIEVRWSDSGWGPDNDRNLAGRFPSRSFTIPRLSQVQNCYLRQYDGSTPSKYSRFTAALHLDMPL